MSPSVISIPADSTEESVRSSASLIILSDFDSEVPPSPVHHVVANPKTDPSEAESEPLSSQAIPPPEAMIARWRVVDIPFGRPYRTLPNGVRKLLTAKKRVHPFLARIPSNRRRSHYVSSSSSPLPRKRHKALPYLFSSSSSSGILCSSFETSSTSDTPTLVGASRKRCRSPATSLLAVTLSPTALVPVRVEEQKALKDRAETAETERTNLRERVRSLEISDLSLRDTLRAEKEAYARIEHQLKNADYSFRNDSRGYRTIGQRVAEALEAREAISNNGNENKNEAKNRNEVNGGSMFRISNCSSDLQVKFATYTLVDGALTWWNSHVQIVGIDEAYGMSWKDLMKLMIEVYCSRNEIQKLESKLWNLCVKDAIKKASILMDQKVRTYAAKNAENKRMWESNPRDNRVQQPPFKRHNVATTYIVGANEKKAYARTLPYCIKCKLHHTGQCIVKCGNYRKNRRNQTGNNEARGRAYALGGGEVNPDSNVVTCTFLPNNRYASILFDSGTDRSFVSTTFSSLIDIVPTTLDINYAVKIADERVIECDTIIRECTLNLLDHPFNIYLMPVKLGSFDIIVGMDWLSKYHAVIVCDEKIVRIPYGNEVLTI
ncbi:reverse transcriptase domain-containing protein [Tanacetum coccineum]